MIHALISCPIPCRATEVGTAPAEPNCLPRPTEVLLPVGRVSATVVEVAVALCPPSPRPAAGTRQGTRAGSLLMTTHVVAVGLAAVVVDPTLQEVEDTGTKQALLPGHCVQHVLYVLLEQYILLQIHVDIHITTFYL